LGLNRETLIQKLKTDIAQGRVVIIAGTGVSIAGCGNQKIEGHLVASWPGLLQHGLGYCRTLGAADEEDTELLGNQIKSNKTNFLISAAEDISQRLQSRSPGVFQGWLKNTVGALVLEHREILDALTALPGVLATLNYDSLIEHASGRKSVTWLREDKVQDILRREITDGVLHLHGWFDEPESVVLGSMSYQQVASHPHTKAVLQLFTIDRTLLFIGCGGTVKDPNFSRLVDWAKEALKDIPPRHVLLCREDELDTLRADLASAPWLQPLVYGKDYEELVPFLRSLAPPGGATILDARTVAGRGFDLEAYQQAMRKRYSRLKLEELDPTTHDTRSLTLTGMFIAQSARECPEFMPRVFELPKELQRRLRETGELEGAELDEETLAQHRRAYLGQSPRSVLEVLNQPALNRLVILGDPGSGKSTLLQYLLLQWAQKAVPNFQQEPMPLLIELREYARFRSEGKIASFLEYLHSGASVRWHFEESQLDAWLKANPSLVLFDGLDEVFNPTLRREISTAIHRFADNYPRIRIVVTSRIIGYQYQTWRDENFRHFMLQELDHNQIADFLTRWHRSAYEEPRDGDAKRELLACAIADSVAIRQLAGNPLLLTMMAILNRTQDLPRDRAELYEQCARLLLHQWKVDVAFSYPELANASLDFKDKRNLLLRVARAMQTSERGLAGNLIDERSLEITLEAGLKGIPNLRADRAARALIEQLRGRNFMLCSVGGYSYAFVHRTFLEYFCASEIRERFQTDQTLTLEQLKNEIFGQWEDESWHEVLCLLAGMIAPHFVVEILEYLLEQPDPKQTCQATFLAARCLGEVRKRNELETIATRVRYHVKALLGFDLNFHYKPWGDESRKVSAIRTRAVSLVAMIWRDSRDTHTWLKARAHSDEDSWVRQAAVRELARGWKEDPETLSILKARAHSDEHAFVRQAAVRELARGWKQRPETLQWLKAWTKSDNRAVRQAAMEELARSGKEDPRP
jgi:hypothetical protein